MDLKIIARIQNDFPTKFGLPRQSGLVDSNVSRIVFEPEFRDVNAVKGIEQYSHLWLLWHITEFDDGKWSPTVRPPKLGGNTRIGVFATRSPNRPNPIGLTCVKLLGVEKTQNNGHILIVSGADIMNGTPILDIKPYIPYADCRPDAIGSFADEHVTDRLTVDIPQQFTGILRPDAEAALHDILANDPRPAYHSDKSRVYGFAYAGHEIKFTVDNNVLTVTSIE